MTEEEKLGVPEGEEKNPEIDRMSEELKQMAQNVEGGPQQENATETEIAEDIKKAEEFYGSQYWGKSDAEARQIREEQLKSLRSNIGGESTDYLNSAIKHGELSKRVEKIYRDELKRREDNKV